MLRLSLLLAAAATLLSAAEPPKTWIDPDTGHRIVRLTDEPGSASLYFNQNGYTADGKKMVYTTPTGISVFELATHTAKQVVEGRVRVIVTGRKSPTVYYSKENAVWATDVDTLVSRKIADLPKRGNVSTVNADETLLGGTFIEGDGPTMAPTGRRRANRRRSISP
jgi:oligogalacturonide lyase